ncbi:hypothetical protein AB0I81_31190 [Nonomuraea sp. NPDC050404]|uniref:hypothetical protein n=1 Tax=Nonomuraea sp. NPDC050404 TaxID=3155783 RepID=UPI0033D3E8E5
MLITRHAEAEAVLRDTRYVPPPVRQDGEEGTLAWLRARVSRFSTGETHALRRRELTGLLSGLDLTALRSAARTATSDRGGRWRGVPTVVLAAALGLDDPRTVADAVAAAATGYLSGEESPQADAAVAELLKSAGIPAITLLLQAHASTEALIENALTHTGHTPTSASGHAASSAPGLGAVPARERMAPGDIDALLHETLRQDPPLKATRRLDTRTGDEVTIDLVAANRDPGVFPAPELFDTTRGQTPHLTFGHGVRPCPASAHALALAAGVLEGVLG